MRSQPYILVVQKLWPPLTFDDSGGSSIASRNKLRLASLFGAILVVLGGQNRCPKPILELFFAMPFSKAFWHRNFVDFWKLETRKIAISSGKTMIFTKSAFSIKIQKTLNFHSIFRSQSEENSNKNQFKDALFFSIAFSTFFLGFGLRFGSQKSFKNHNFRKNWGSKASSEAVSLWSCFSNGFWGPRSSIFMDLSASGRCFLIPSSTEQRYAWSMSGCRPYFDD